jgi:uncharacterized membrane protein YedE/YeeE
MFETAFTPWASLGGGVLIGLSAVLLMLVVGRVSWGPRASLRAFSRLPRPMTSAWRAALLLGMVTGPAVFWLATGAMPEVTVPVSTPMLIVGGLIVGVGVTYGSGCTSGHGVCGMARLSPAVDRGDADLHGDHRGDRLRRPPRDRRLTRCTLISSISSA